MMELCLWASVICAFALGYVVSERIRKWWSEALRVCARCGRVFIGKQRACPGCGFGHYQAIWAIGWKRTLLRLLTGTKR